MALMLGALSAMGLLMVQEPQGREISWQEFCSQLLESGEVRGTTLEQGRQAGREGC